MIAECRSRIDEGLMTDILDEFDYDVRFKMETVKDAGGKEWIGVFTFSEEMYKGSVGNV